MELRDKKGDRKSAGEEAQKIVKVLGEKRRGERAHFELGDASIEISRNEGR